MVTAWAPVAIASDACTLKIGLCFVGRLPEAPSRKPLHFSVGMFFADPVERRQQIRTLCSAKGCRQSSSENCPIRITRWHLVLAVVLLFYSGPRRLSFSTSVVRLIRSNSAALLRLPPVRSSER